MEDVDRIDGPPWTLEQVMEWTVLMCHMIGYYDVVYGSLTCLLMDGG